MKRAKELELVTNTFSLRGAASFDPRGATRSEDERELQADGMEMEMMMLLPWQVEARRAVCLDQHDPPGHFWGQPRGGSAWHLVGGSPGLSFSRAGRMTSTDASRGPLLSCHVDKSTDAR